MSSFIIRPKKGHRPLWQLSEAGYAKAKEHLLAAGIDIDRSPKIDWPDDAVSAHREHIYAHWEYTTRSDVLKARKERMERCLWWKREYSVVQRRALYVWVFWCPGISGIFEGLWTYIVGIGRDYHGGGYKGQVEGHCLEKVMELFPLVDKPLFPDWRYYDQWQEQFIKKYPAKTKWCGKPQGKAPVWALVKGGTVREILGRAQWPNNRKNPIILSKE